MKPIIDSRPFPVCILRSGDPARAHQQIDLAETIARNTPPIQSRVSGIKDDYELTDSLDYLSNRSFK